jgi:hypothetical protein
VWYAMEWLSLISTFFSSGLNPGVETIMLRADDYRGIRLDFCPSWYANEFVGRGESKAEIYLRELGQPAVARNIEATSYGHATFFPGRARMCNRFELYDTCRPERFDQ